MPSEKDWNRTAIVIDTLLASAFGYKVGFILLVQPFHDPTATTNYLSNCERETSVETMRRFLREYDRVNQAKGTKQ